MKNFNELKILFIMTAVGIGVSGCAGPNVSAAIADANDPVVVEKFVKELAVIGDAASDDPNYKRIPLDTKEDQSWFTSVAFLLWDNQITREAFISEGITRFPEHKESFEYIAKKLNDTL
jgi:hypothetical protein